MDSLIVLILTLPAIIIGLTVHEFAHAYVAYLCGDYTAKSLGRISLNPLKHIDPLGFIFIILAGFGWAKPVAFNEYNLKNRDTDVVKIAAAGPISNAILAVLFSLIFALIAKYTPASSLDSTSFGLFIKMLYYAIFVNWGLFVFNLIPIPPLDGSHVFLNNCKNHPSYPAFEKLWTIGLFAILIIQSSTGMNILPIGPIVRFLGEMSLKMFGYS